MGKAQIFVSDEFDDFAQKERITDQALCKAIEEIERGLIHADLGGHVLKQRIARPGSGKSSGYRTIILFKQESRAVFVAGYAKNDKANLTERELQVLKDLAKDILSLSESQVNRAVSVGKLREVARNE